MIKTRTITGFDAFTKLIDYDDKSETLLNVQSSVRSSIYTPNSSKFTEIVFGPCIEEKINRYPNANEDVDEIDTSQKLHKNPHRIAQQNEKIALIRKERQLFVPKTMSDNKNAPWEMTILRIHDSDLTPNEKKTHTEIDQFLNSIDHSAYVIQNMPRHVSQNTTHRNSMPGLTYDTSTQCHEHKINENMKNQDNTSQDSESSDNTSQDSESLNNNLTLHRTNRLIASQQQYQNVKNNSMHDFVISLLKDSNNIYRSYEAYVNGTIDRISSLTPQGIENGIRRISNTLYLLMVNTVLEKLLKRINTDVKTIDSINPKSFWMSCESSMFDLSDVFFLTPTIRSEQYKIFDHNDLKQRSNHREIHKKHMIDYVKRILSDNVVKPKIGKRFFVCDDTEKIIGFDEYGIGTGLKNHPFIFYYVADGHCQLYKLIITDFNFPSKVNYKLYQIDTLPSSETCDKFVTRPLIISRDITDKFVAFVGPSSKHEKFIIQKNFIKLEVNEHELRDKDVILLHRLNDYATYWASFMNIIMNDATRCIRAYIRNSKKNKILFNPSIHKSIIESLLFETDNPDLLFDHTQQIHIRKDTIKMLKDMKLIHDDSLQRIDESLLCKTFHPYSRLISEVGNKQFKQHCFSQDINNNTIEIQRSNDIFDFNNQISKNIVLVKHRRYHYYLRDMVWMNTEDGEYEYIDDISLNMCYITDTNNIICNLRISSNLFMKIYIRVNDTCMMVGEGHEIRFPIIYEHIVHNMFIKHCADPDLVHELLKKTNIPPFVQIDGTWINTNHFDDSTVFDDGCIIDCVSFSGSPQETQRTYLKAKLEIDEQMYFYFSEVKDHHHMKQIETSLQLDKYLHPHESGTV